MARSARKSSSGGKINLASRAKKKTFSRSPLKLDEKYTGTEPTWEDALNWDLAKFRSNFHRACYYYNYFNSAKDLVPSIVQWMQNHGYQKADIKAFKAGPDNVLTTTVGSVASMLLNGMPPAHPDNDENHEEWLRSKIAAHIELGKVKLDEQAATENSKSNVVQLTVHDRVRDTAYEHIQKFEDWLEDSIVNPSKFDPKSLNILDYFKANEVNQAHARIIRAYYIPLRDEIALAIAPPKNNPTISQQIIEGYSCYTKAQLKNKLIALDEIIAATEMSVQQAKVNRKPRVKKAPSKEKLVSKVKYKATDDRLKLVSIKPEECLQKLEVWVYNTKTRKVGVYVAQDTQALSIKGSSIINFNEAKSIAKTVRKPEEFFKGFAALPKTKMMKTFEAIKSVDQKLSGRLSEDVVIIKAFA